MFTRWLSPNRIEVNNILSPAPLACPIYLLSPPVKLWDLAAEVRPQGEQGQRTHAPSLNPVCQILETLCSYLMTHPDLVFPTLGLTISINNLREPAMGDLPQSRQLGRWRYGESCSEAVFVGRVEAGGGRVEGTLAWQKEEAGYRSGFPSFPHSCHHKPVSFLG